MKSTITSTLLILLSIKLAALSVTPDQSTLSCGITSITFTFDCPFSGTVLVTNPPNGVMYDQPLVKSVTNGSLSFDIDINSSAPQTFTTTFVVINSDMMSCAANNASASAVFTSTCILPQNNDCVDAISLDISSNSCIPIAFSTYNATYSGSIPSCGIPQYLDLFYTFNANNDSIYMEIPSVPGSVGFYGLFDGCPGSGNQLDCSIMIASQGSSYLFTNLIVGTDYYLQILFIPSSAGTNQEICLHSTTPQSNPNCLTSVTVSDNGPYLPSQSYTTSQDINTSGSCILSNNGIIFDAGTEIILSPGFDTATFDFEAIIGGCTP